MKKIADTTAFDNRRPRSYTQPLMPVWAETAGRVKKADKTGHILILEPKQYL